MTRRAQLPWIPPGTPPDSFPDPRLALATPNGLLAVGGDLAPERLLAAYRRGIFPWFSDGEPVLWWSPDPRAVIHPQELHLSRRFRRTLRSGRFNASVNQAFTRIITLCGETRRESGTWLGPEMIAAYTRLHHLGFAHSVESWVDGRLAGGIYGVAIGSVFFGESMVSLVPDGSKAALAALAAKAGELGIRLIDCQVPNPHLGRMGAVLMPREDFLEKVHKAVLEPPLKRFEMAAPAPIPLQA